METIRTYLDNMFLHLPNTPEVTRAKRELAAMMEDKYNELLAEGKKQNEAVGIVISEFGNLNELAEDLGIGSFVDEAANQDYVGHYVTLAEAEDFIATSIKSNKRIGIGVLLCIWSPILLILFAGLQELFPVLSEKMVVACGVAPLFIFIGIAVAIFIYSGTQLERFEYMKKETLQLDPSYDRELADIENQIRPSSIVQLIIGILMCVFSPLPLIILSITENDFASILGVVILLFTVGVGVSLIIASQGHIEAIKVLRQEGEYTVASKSAQKLVDVVAGVYWPVVTLIYLGISFVTMSWATTWIIWPLAGILFGIIAVICNVIQNTTKRA